MFLGWPHRCSSPTPLPIPKRRGSLCPPGMAGGSPKRRKPSCTPRVEGRCRPQKEETLVSLGAGRWGPAPKGGDLHISKGCRWVLALKRGDPVLLFFFMISPGWSPLSQEPSPKTFPTLAQRERPQMIWGCSRTDPIHFLLLPRHRPRLWDPITSGDTALGTGATSGDFDPTTGLAGAVPRAVCPGWSGAELAPAPAPSPAGLSA